MSVLQRVARVAATSAIAVLVVSSLSAAQESGQLRIPLKPNGAGTTAKSFATTRAGKQPVAPAARSSANNFKNHRLILQVNTNDPAAMNLALNNALNVTEYYKRLGDNVKIEVITFGPGLHMLREDTSPVKARIEVMALSTPEISFKACGNTQQNMHKAENKDIPLVPQAQVVKSGVVHVMELQEQGWTYVKP
jgi:intracellular sulfur oxidation DsrE/DsrF family protein